MSRPSSVEPLETARRRRRALELRLQKVSLRRIADELGISPTRVKKYVDEETVIMLPKEEADVLRTHECNTLDEMENNARRLVDWMAQENVLCRDAGEASRYGEDAFIKAQDHVLRIQKRRSVLLGLDMPVKVEHAIRVRTEFDQEIERLVAELAGGGKLLSGPEDVDLEFAG